MKERVFLHPKKVISDYLTDIMCSMNVQVGDAWAISEYSEKVRWGKMPGLGRIHFHTSHALELALKGQADESAAYLVQVLQSVHQANIDGGGWHIAMHLLPRDDPWEKVLFGGSQGELKTIAGYQEALRKLQKGSGRGGEASHEDSKGGSKGGGRGGKKKETGGGDGQ
jgi:hypothetical protein